MHYIDGLETPRLITRFVTMDDVDAWLEYYADPLATVYTAVPGMSPEDATHHIISHTLLRYRQGRLGLQALICKESGVLLGMCGLILQEVGGVQEVEIGYHLLRRHWGKGYATEAAHLFRDYAFEQGMTDTLISIIHPQNTPSQKVALRNGMQAQPEPVLFHGRERLVYRIGREEWERGGLQGMKYQ